MCAALFSRLPCDTWDWEEAEPDGGGAGGRLGMLELLLWAVLAERNRLAKLLWQHTEEPIRYALLVSQLYAHLAQREKTQSAQREKLALSGTYEGWAVAMLGSCREEVAIELLEDDFEGRWPNQLLDLAIAGGSKRFVAHEYCEELLDLTPTYPYLRLRTPTYRYARASASARRLVDETPASIFASELEYTEPLFALPWYVDVRFGRWEALLERPMAPPASVLLVTTATAHWARALAYSALGRIEQAEAEQAAFETAAALV